MNQIQLVRIAPRRQPHVMNQINAKYLSMRKHEVDELYEDESEFWDFVTIESITIYTKKGPISDNTFKNFENPACKNDAVLSIKDYISDNNLECPILFK